MFVVSGYVLADNPMRWHCKQYVRKANENEFDVFISYSRDDYEWVKTLFLQLKSEGFAVCVDFKDFVPGEEVSENIMNAIYKSRKTIVVMSTNFLNSVWGQFEMQQALCKSIAKRQDTLILIKFSKCKVPRKLMGKTFLNWTSVKENSSSGKG
ncbi:hypothetical protein KUTeg_015729 [Tegillarca granosa]|uniref:TIR domain-containing protein n=1 Tax=Tegillarca granosa TaxID=220873 RepID=A0ABQ9ETQ6_TEGGR|nr:hypothetical protein KUTeg_015729 [Tegillarca granosa]